MSTSSKGAIAERLAQKYLKSKGFQILDMNVHLGKYSELDIVAIKDSVVHVVEVKASFQAVTKREQITFPIFNITPNKVRKLCIGAQLYQRKNQLSDYDLTVDAIGIIVDQNQSKSWVKFFPNILEGVIG